MLPQLWRSALKQTKATDFLLHFRFKYMCLMAVDTSLLKRLQTSLHYWRNITSYAVWSVEINIVRNTDTYSEVLGQHTHCCTIDLRKKHTSNSSGFQIIVILFKKESKKKNQFYMVTETFRPVNTPNKFD